MKKSSKVQILEDHNIGILAELVADPSTSEWLKIQIIQKINEARGGVSFFQTLVNENLSYGECPCCSFKTHWLCPEDILNEMGIVSYKEDPRVLPTTDSTVCPEFHESCQKKKVTV